MKRLSEYYRLLCKKVDSFVVSLAWRRFEASALRRSARVYDPPVRDPMSSGEFRERMLKFVKRTREFQGSEGADEPSAVTKIGGAPWWPEGVDRPWCRYEHEMNFVAQILLSDVPLENMPENSLVSFHYCNQCVKDDRMAFGCFDTENRGYDLRIFHNVDKVQADMKGLISPSLTKSYSITFRDVEEVPGGSAQDAYIKHVNLPIDFFDNHDGSEDEFYPGLKHIYGSKLGGWPSWVQCPEWPTYKRRRYKFLGQFSCELFDGAPWDFGGDVYLFIIDDENGKLKCEMLIQNT